MITRFLAALGVGACVATPATAQFAVGAGAVQSLYEQHCASCHGRAMEGGMGGSLIDDVWVHGGDDAALAAAIRDGFPEGGMVGFADVLTEEDIRALVILIREQNHLADARPVEAFAPDEAGVFASQRHDFVMETVLETDGAAWGVDFLPDGAMLITVRDGSVLIARDGEAVAVEGAPRAWVNGQGGMLDVAVHPDYAENGWIYLAFSATQNPNALRSSGNTKIVRGRLREGRWVDEQTIFETPREFHTPARHHFGTRMVFQDGYLFFAIGDRGVPEKAQDLANPAGKIHRVHEDGRVPEDNPFVGREDAYPTIWTWGNRNPQGLALQPADGALYAVEHGPRGGDELNRIERGLNYGWPEITYGLNYNGRPITDATEQEGMEQPVTHWTPSIAVSSMAFYAGDVFEAWSGDILVGGLTTEELRRLRIDNDVLVEEEVLMKHQGRVRDVVLGPDGSVVIALNSADSRRSRIVRLHAASPS